VEPREWVPSEIDTERPSSARVYDYFLGGAHNFAVDRQMAEQVLRVAPDTKQIVWTNRAFLRRAVEFLVAAGVRQFLDIGSGVPTVGHVHEIAQSRAPESRVVFVDVDPVAVAHSRLMLAGNDRTAVIAADVRSPDRIVTAPEVQELLDLSQPVAVLVVALFHFIPDTDDPVGIVSRLTAPLASGSYVAISHFTEDSQDRQQGKEVYQRSGIDLFSRTKAQVEALFAGHDLVEPGVVWAPEWHPDIPEDIPDKPQSSLIYAGVGRKP
jgi:hypothetical protein